MPGEWLLSVSSSGHWTTVTVSSGFCQRPLTVGLYLETSRIVVLDQGSFCPPGDVGCHTGEVLTGIL